ncbi:MAG: hypothetical protein JSW70_08660 [Syntrophobacterales bacterium]|nr:MAG: hypothetical protein JSW70_08660 [Syntrophobacterales bacterium]
MFEKELAEIEHLIQKQNRWRDKCINFIASENVMSKRARSQAVQISPTGMPKGIHGKGITGGHLISTKSKTG